MGTSRTGRPAGLLLNPQAFEHLLGERTRTEVAGAARIKLPVLSEMLNDQRGCSKATAERLGDVMGCEPGVLFPELVGFTTTVRYFTANGAWVSE